MRAPFNMHILPPSHGMQLDPDNWLRHHRLMQYITASEIPTILGMNQYKSPLEVYNVKMGVSDPPPTTVAMRRGHALEDLIAELYEESQRVQVLDPGDYFMAFTAWKYPFGVIDHMYSLCCTPDRFTSEGTLVEMKAPARQPGAQEYQCYMVQLKMQMYITGWNRGRLAVLAGNDFHVSNEVLMDEQTKHAIENLWIPEIDKFVRCMYLRTPPAPRSGNGKRVEPAPFKEGVLEDARIAPVAAEYLMLQGMMKDLRARSDDVRADLVKSLDGYSSAVAGQYVVQRNSVEHKPWLRVEPSIADEFVLAKEGVEYKRKSGYTTMQLRVVDTKEEGEEHSYDSSENEE